MAGGRPTKYEGEVTIAKVEQFLKECVDYPGEDGKTVVNFPSNEKLANYLDVSMDTLFEWSRVHPEFSDIYKKVQHKQAARLVDSGLGGQYMSTITKLILTKHGYHDISENNLKNDGGKFEPSNLTPEMIALAKKYEEDLKKTL